MSIFMAVQELGDVRADQTGGRRFVGAVHVFGSGGGGRFALAGSMK